MVIHRNKNLQVEYFYYFNRFGLATGVCTSLSSINVYDNKRVRTPVMPVPVPALWGWPGVSYRAVTLAFFT